MSKEITEIFGSGVLLELNGADLNRHQLHYSKVKDGHQINCTDEIHSSPEVAGAIFQSITTCLTGFEPLKRKVEALHYVNKRADRKIAELTEKNSAAIDALKLNERLITKLIEHCDGDLMDLLSEDVAFATNANLKILSRLKTSKQWQTEIYDELVIMDPDGWDRQNLEHSFEVELITLDEFNRRLSLSTTLISTKKANDGNIEK